MVDTGSTTARHQPRRARDRHPAHRPQLLGGRPDHPRRRLRRQPREHRAVVDHRLRLDRRRERLLHRRRQHHRRRVRLPGQGAQLRVHPGGRRQDRRLRGRVRPLDRRHHQRHHQVGRQRVPRRPLRLLRLRLAAEATPSRWCRPAAPSPASPARTTALDLGGYLIKDKLWFFAAYDRVSNSLDSTLPAGPRAGTVVTAESDRDLAAAKLTWRLQREPVADRQLLPGPARRHRRDQRRPAHAQRRSPHLRGRAQLRRPRLPPCATRGSSDLSAALAAVGAGRAPRGGELGRRRRPAPATPSSSAPSTTTSSRPAASA